MVEPFVIVTLPLVKQRQVIEKKPVITYEFISHKDTKRFLEFAHLAHLLDLNEGGYLKNTFGLIWSSGDRYAENGLVGAFDVFVTRANGAIVGYILHETATGTVDTFVLPHWRRRGVATGLVAELRRTLGDKRVLTSWSATKNQEASVTFFAKNFIVNLDYNISDDQISKHGDFRDAERAITKSLKIKMSAAYRKWKSSN